MMNPFHDIDWNPDRAGLKNFARSIAIGMPLLALAFGALGWLRTSVWPAWTWWLAGVGGATGISLWLAPRIARPFYLVWNALGCVIGFVMSNVALGAIYWLVVTPIGLALRICGRDALRLREKEVRESFWEDAEKSGDATRYFRQY